MSAGRHASDRRRPLTAFQIRVPPALKARIETGARLENNGVSAYTRRLLTAALDREDEMHRPPRDVA